ncbi:MAG: O-antigen ligase family protein [Candidatus Pseudobacter hemicellulosilyticus]|uniref:O-antigen ligase family protein n=1 Tax=Candidatus Pseudobacter hemicellulosilyticus TaxID=3121375 RepID=A0AAJ6BIF6_9BACT|nr:MAG: O-antigen ligase family protein [Pseudobacter sp.]
MERNLIHKASESLKEWLRYHVFTRKLTTPVGIAILGLIAILISYITVLVDYKLSVVLVAAVGIILLCVLCIVYPLFGFYCSYVVTICMMFPERMMNSGTPIPTGLIPEYLAYLAMLGVLTKDQYRKQISPQFWNHSITIWILVLVVYTMLQGINPSMGNKLGWFNYFRKQVSYAAFFYISYCFLNSRKAIFNFTWFWLVISSLNALYCCKQQWLGFSGFEETWLMADPKRYALFVNFGFVRRFGLLSDPAAAGILYACGTVLCLVLALRAKKAKPRILFYLLAAIHFMATSYTGTRTGTLMVVAGVVLYCVMTLYDKRTVMFCGVFAFGLTALLVAPIYNNQIINRLRSTFEGSKDPSALVRDVNRHIAQPYVYSHPFGGGINTSGLAGSMYNPGHYLNSIPPDSGYMQVMLEQGPVGLLFTCIFYFVILRTGIRWFYRVKDEELKTLYVAHLAAIFTLMVAQYSQLAIGQYPSVLYFYSVLAMLLKLHQYDSSRRLITD